MWISKEHWALIRERAAECRAWHEEQMADRGSQVAALITRLAQAEADGHRAVQEAQQAASRAATEFRSWHEEQMRDKEAQIRALDSRIIAMETERTDLLDRLFTRQQERERPPAALPNDPHGDWMAEMQRQAEAAQAAAEQGGN